MVYNEAMMWALRIGGVLVALAVLALFSKSIMRLFGVVTIPTDSIGTITKKFTLVGKNKRLPDGHIIALNGEAGYQADTLSPGVHFWFWPWQYTIRIEKFIVIPNGKIGLIKARDGVPLQSGHIVAKHVPCDSFQDARAFLLNGGERGPQRDIIPPGVYRINVLLFDVEFAEQLTVPAGKIGVVEAKDGKPMPPGRVIARSVACDTFQDADAFLSGGGERGPQMSVIQTGSYRINPYLFVLGVTDVTNVPDNMVGIITTRDGTPLDSGDIAGPVVEGHNSFQNPQAFIDGGGRRGLQEQVLLAGQYFLNPRFVDIEVVPMTEIPIANVGVVISYVGKRGVDISGDAFKHGNIVENGYRGVWNRPLDPGKYPINPYVQKVAIVPTNNVVLNWATGKTEAHKLDANLSTIGVRSGDGFKYNLDVSQIIHIPVNEAPKVISRFGSMQDLVTQVLEPTIGNYFRNAAQSSDVIDFLKNRTERQSEARKAITAALAEFNVGAVDTLIGDISPPESLMQTLTDRKIAEQQQVTFETQQKAATVRQSLAQASALADTQPQVVTAERQVAIKEFEAKAQVASANGNAQSNVINAEANAKVLRVMGDAQAANTEATGGAEANVIRKKTEAMKTENYAAVQIAEWLSKSAQPLVPVTLINGEAGGDTNAGILTLLLAQTLKGGAVKIAA